MARRPSCSFQSRLSVQLVKGEQYLDGYTIFQNYFRVGGKEGSSVECRGCRGRGIKTTIRQIGPGMVQQMQGACTDCRGEGEPF